MSTESTVAPIFPLDLTAERALLGDQLEEAVLRVLHSGQYVLGPEVACFEAGFADLCGVPHAVGVTSGTEAIVIALKAAGVEPGDEVVTSPFTFFASAAAVVWSGAVPRLADVDPATALLDLDATRAATTAKTRALLPVHLYGQMVDVHAFRALADERGVALVEDAAQAHGARFGDAAPGQVGDCAAFSFYPTKNLGAAGEAGLVTTARDAVGERARLLRDHGSPKKYEHAFVGTNARMHAFQAAVLSVKLPHLAGWNDRRRTIAARYDAALTPLDGVHPLRRAAEATHVYHQYTVRIEGDDDRRGRVQAHLAEAGVHAAVHYPKPVHLQEAARDWGYGPGDFPHAEALAREVLCLPVHPFLTDEAVDRVLDATATALQATA